MRVGLSVLCLVLLPRATARGAEVDVALDAVLPSELAGCVDTQRLRTSYLETLAAYGDEGSQGSALRLRVNERERAAAEPETVVLEVSVSSAGRELGGRTLPVKAGDCAALPNTLALVLVLLAHTATPAPAAPTPNPEPLPPTAASEPSIIALSAGAQALFGVLPHSALGLQLQAATMWQPVSIRLVAGMLWPQVLPVAEGSIRWQSYELALEACSAGLQPTAWLSIRLCAGPRAGLLLARSEHFALQTKGAGVAVLYAGVLPEAALRLGAHTWLQLGAGVAVALLRPQFFVALDGGQRVRVFDDPALLRGELALSLTQIF